MIKIGKKSVVGAKLGSHNILKVYMGSDLYADFTGGGGGGGEITGTFTYSPAEEGLTFFINSMAYRDVEGNGTVAYDGKGVITKMSAFCVLKLNIVEIDLTELDMSNVTDVSSMFEGNEKLNTINFGETLNPSIIERYGRMLYNNKSLTDIYCTQELRDFIYSKQGTGTNDIGMTTADLNKINWHIIEKIDYYELPLTVEALSDGTLTFADHVPTNNLYVKVNGGDSQVMTADNKSVTVNGGDKIEMYCTSSSRYYNTSYGIISTDFQFNLYGNINSMYYGDDFVGKEVNGMIGDYMFSYWFYISRVVETHNLILPYMEVAIDGYGSMFRGCTSLQTAPQLPATTIKGLGYEYMFNDCTSLVNAPSVLPGTELGDKAYNHMFYGCTSLQTIPKILATNFSNNYICQGMFRGCSELTKVELPSNDIKNYCYQEMFRGCSKLNYVKCLTNTTGSETTKKNWLYAASPTGTFVKKRGVNWTTGDNGIPSGWTVEEVD